MGWLYLIDFVSHPLDVQDGGKLLESIRAYRFLNQLMEETEGALKSPGGTAAACAIITAGFKLERDAHLKCSHCCPTDAEKKTARKNLFCSKAACSNKEPVKIIHVDWVWPRDLPPSFLTPPYNWVENTEKVSRCIETMLDPSHGDEFGSSRLNPSHIMSQSRDQLFTCLAHPPESPEFIRLSSFVDSVTQQEFLISIHVKYDPGDAERMRSWMQTSKSPFIKSVLSINGEELKIRRRLCDVCSIQEEISGKFPVCGACKSVVYCSDQCQKTAWVTHKRSCVTKKKAKQSS